MTEIKKHFELSVNLKFDIDNTLVKDLNGLNLILTVKNKPHKEIKQLKKLDKILNKMQKTGWTVSTSDLSINNRGN